MAVAFNPSEEVREGGHHPHHHHHTQHHHQSHATSNNSANSAAIATAAPQETASVDTSVSSSAVSSQSSSPSSSTNSSPGAVSGPMPIPQTHYQHPNVAGPVYYYPAGSPLVPPHSPVPPTATVYRQYNNEELIQAICEALHRCSNGSCPYFTLYYLLLVLVSFFD